MATSVGAGSRQPDTTPLPPAGGGDSPEVNLDQAQAMAKRGEARKAEGQHADKKAGDKADGAKSDGAHSSTGVASLEAGDGMGSTLGLEASGQTAAAQGPEIPTGGPNTWAASFEELLDKLPGQVGEPGAQFGLEDVQGQSLPALFVKPDPATLEALAMLRHADTTPRGPASSASHDTAAPGTGADGAFATQQNPSELTTPNGASGDSEASARIKVFHSYDRLVSRFFAKAQSEAKMPNGEPIPAHVKHAQQLAASAYHSYLTLTPKGGAAAAGMGMSAAKSTAAAGEEAPEIPGPVIQKMELAAKEVVSNATDSRGAASPQSAASDRFAGLDIDALMIVVMMDASQVEESLLRDKLKELQQTSAQKQQLRDVKTKMKQESARLDGQMLQEFNSLKSSGQIASDKKYEDYKAWRQVQYADVRENLSADGTRSMAWPPAQLEVPCPPIPEYLAKPASAGAVAPSTSSGNDSGTKYGIPPALENKLKQMFAHFSQDDKDAVGGNFDAWLQSLGLAPAQSVQDITDNLNKINNALGDARNNASMDVLAENSKRKYNWEAANSAKIAANKADSIGSKVPPQLRQEMDDYVKATALKAMGFDDGGDSQRLQDDINRQLKKHFDPGFQDDFRSVMVDIKDKYSKAVLQMQTSMERHHNEGPNCAGYPKSSWSGGDKHIDDFNGADLAAGATWGDIGSFQTQSWLVGHKTHSISGKPSNLQDWTWDKDGGHGKFEASGGDQWSGNIDLNFHGPSTDPNFPGFGPNIEQTIKDLQAGMNVGGPAKYNDVKKAANQLRPDPDSNNKGQGFDLGGLKDLNDGIPPKNYVDKDFSASSPPSPEELAQMASFGIPGADGGALARGDSIVKKYLDDLGPGHEKSVYAGWVHQQHLDGSTETKAEANVDAAVADAKKASISDGMGGTLENQGSLASFDAYAQTVDDKLQSMGDMSEQESLQIQIMMERRSKFIETLSNLIKKVDSTEENIVSNIK